MKMFKILAINEFGSNQTLELPIIPRIGDTIPIFHHPYPKVKAVVLIPEKMMPECSGFDAARKLKKKGIKFKTSYLRKSFDGGATRVAVYYMPNKCSQVMLNRIKEQELL